MADISIVNEAVASTPEDYKVPGAQEILLKAVGCTVNGKGASGTFVPALQMLDPAGHVMWTAVNESAPVAVGRSALVSWFPGGGINETTPVGTTTSSPSGIQSLTTPRGTLSIANPTGPLTNIDMPTTGVSVGSYGDASHSVEITVDAEGRLTSAAQVGIAGGSSTIGFEVGYDQITSFATISSTSEVTPTTLITCASHTFDGAAVFCTFFTPFVQNSTAGGLVTIGLWESTTEITRLGIWSGNATVAQIDVGMTCCFRFTPTAGAHTYLIKGFAANTTGSPGIGAGTGSGANYPPAFVRFTKV